jgi:D-alanine-D-alanine ligase
MRNIAILAGGYTSERHISFNSANQVLNSLDKDRYNVFMIDVNPDGFFLIQAEQKIVVDLNTFSVNLDGKNIKFDYAYIVIHGAPGEDGKVQALLDLIHIPYSACNVLSSAISFNKVVCKKILFNSDISMAKSVVLQNGKDFSVDEVVEITGLPCFVKPNNAGSSYGVTKVYEKDRFIDAVNLALEEDDTIIVEEFIDGVEVSCGVLKTTKKEYVFPVTEIFTKNDYFDTQAKYDPTLTEEITPARITINETKLVQEATSKIYDELNCKGIVRIDYIIRNGIPYFLELNSIPGMSAESIVPKQLRNIGKSMTEITTEIIEDSF